MQVIVFNRVTVDGFVKGPHSGIQPVEMEQNSSIASACITHICYLLDKES